MENIVNEMDVNEKKIKSKNYTEAHKLAQKKYREKNREKYNQSQRELYIKLKQDNDWKQKFNKRSAKNNNIYRQKKKDELLEENNNIQIKVKGCPKKIIVKSDIVKSDTDNLIKTFP